MDGEVQIKILGPLEVRGPSGELVGVPGSRLRILLIKLALEPGRVVTREQLVSAVWDGDPPDGAANALQSLVSRLRRALPGSLVESHAAGYRLAVGADAVDAHRFEALARRGRAALADDPGGAARILREALDLWRGPALADAADAAFAAAPAARLAELQVAAVEDRIEADLLLGHGDRLIAELESLVATHPLRERLRGQHMRALFAAGRPADALRAYDEARRLLGEQLGADPAPVLQELHLAVLRGDVAALGLGVAKPAKPTTGDPGRRTNARAQLTSFVGRDQDLARIDALLGRARLVTITGPGGAGKTRLAVESAGRLSDRFPDGAWIVELAPVSDAADIPPTVLATLQIREVAHLPQARSPAVPPVDRLIGALAGKRLLLVFDNCEHLVADVAGLVDEVLARCPGVRVLATSREPLGITGETLYPLAPLALPPPGATAGEAGATPAVQLFCDRAAAVSSSFVLDATTVGPVVRLCRGLDGMPLAIELAAARSRALSVEQIADRLDDRFRLLTGGSRTAAPRHQTLRAVVDWSWQLLDEAERRLARRLAVFAGGARLEAVERVCGDDGADHVLDLLTALVDKSLVATTYDSSLGEVRYWMLETVRAYAAEKLADAGEEDQVRRAHATYFRDLVERAEPELRRGDQLRWMTRLTAEHDDTHAALRWAVDAGEVDLAIRVIAGIGWYWFLRGHRDSSGLVDRALALPGGAPVEARAVALMVAGFNTAGFGGDHEQALGRFAEATVLTESLQRAGQPLRHPTLAISNALAALFNGDNRGALAGMRQLADHEDPWVRALSHMLAGVSLENLGESADAEEEFRIALVSFRNIGERWGMGHVLAALADRSSWRGDDETTTAYLEEGSTTFTELGDGEDEAHLLVKLALIHARIGQEERARKELTAALETARRLGARDVIISSYRSLAEVARRQGEPAEAHDLLDRAMAEIATVRGDFGQIEALVHAERGRLDVAGGDLEAARAGYLRALNVSLGTDDAPVMARVVELGADIALADGDPERAATMLGSAEALRGGPDRSDRDVQRVRDACATAPCARWVNSASPKHTRGAPWRVATWWSLT